METLTNTQLVALICGLRQLQNHGYPYEVAEALIDEEIDALCETLNFVVNRYDYKGNSLKIDEDGCYSNIPERCPECNCVQAVPNYKDFSNQTIHVCEQCDEEIRLQYC